MPLMRPSATESGAASSSAGGAGNNTHYASVTPATDLASPTFDAKKYLASIHGTTSFASLQTELKELQRTTSDKTEQLKALVSAHFDQYLSCHEAVRTLSDDIKTHQKDNEFLVGDMKTLKQVTDSTLSVMLQRAKEQRKIRNTIAVLNRFRPIFEITTKMKESLQAKEYEKLAQDYCRLKFHQTKANIAALQPALAAAHEIAKKANGELLKHFDDVSLSVKDQKRAISVLEALGLTEKPTLTCLLKQFSFVEAKLAALQQCHATDQATVVIATAALIYRFRTGLWGFVCDVFKPATSNTTTSASKTNTSSSITSSEAESIQQKAWSIISKAVELIERNASPPTAQVLTRLNETFREINSLKKCATATSLNTNITQLKSSFCGKFRVKIVLQFVQQTCAKHQEMLLNEYFESPLQSLATESSLMVTMPQTAANKKEKDEELSEPKPSQPQLALPLDTKAHAMLVDASQVFDEIRNTSMVSSESKVRLSRAPVLTACASDVMDRWTKIWLHVGAVLLLMADGTDSTGAEAMEPSGSVDAKTFRTVWAKEFKHQLLVLLSSLMAKLVDSFSQAVAPPTMMASIAGSMRHKDGKPGVCVLFAIVANCIEIRERHLATVDQWIRQLANNGSSTQPNNTAEFRQLLVEMEAKCMEKYVAMHADPLLRMLRAESSAEDLLPHRAASFHGLAPSSATSGVSSGSGSRTDSLRLDSRSASSSSFDFGAVTPTAVASAMSLQNSIPQDSRPYVFNVLLQLITLSSEVETSLGQYAQCQEYVRQVSGQLTARLTSYLKDSVATLKSDAEPSEWRRIHLLVEIRFFLFALRDHLSEDSKIQLIALEKALEKAKPSEKVAMAQLQLLAQLKHQTKLYLLALQQG